MNEIPACIHHWRLETPSGGSTVKGICKFCKAEREFPTSSYQVLAPISEKYRKIWGQQPIPQRQTTQVFRTSGRIRED